MLIVNYVVRFARAIRDFPQSRWATPIVHLIIGSVLSAMLWPAIRIPGLGPTILLPLTLVGHSLYWMARLIRERPQVRPPLTPYR